MQDIKVRPFSQYINWFPLKVNKGRIYLIRGNQVNEEPSKYFLRHNGEYYSLEPGEGFITVNPEGMLRRRIILYGFRDALREQGFAFKGFHNYIAYWSKTPYSQPHIDIFNAYTGFEFRVVEYNDGEKDTLYLVIDPKVVFIMCASIQELIDKGVDIAKLTNMSVKVISDQDEDMNRINGLLVEINSDLNKSFKCKIIDARNNDEYEVEADRIYLEPRPEIITSLIRDMGGNFDVVKFQREKSFLNSRIASRDRFQKTQEIVSNYLLEEARVFPLEIGEFIIELDQNPVPVKGSGFPREGNLIEPGMLFDRSDSSAVHLQAYWGLRTFGSYTKNLPEIKLALLGTKIGLIKLKMLVEKMNKGTQIMPGGMARFFNSRLEIVDEFMIKSDSMEDYIKGAESLGSRHDRRSEVNVVIVYLPKRTQEFEYDTPYYNVKPILLQHGLPSQMVTPPALANDKWIHSNLGSAIFAKAGGHPWVLAEHIPEFDMIVGIGLSEAISKTNRAGARPRFIGYANVFDENGRWLFFESTSQMYETDNHQEQLAEVISGAIDSFEMDRGKKPKSISIHYYKRFGSREIELVSDIVNKKIGESRIAFISIDNSHPMRLYEISQTPDGSFPRAKFAQLSSNEFLLSTTGHTDLAKKRLGTPKLLKVSFQQYPTEFVEMKSIASQILSLTRLNYKTLTPVVGEPVTLIFANLVAKFTAAFSENQWKEANNNILGRMNKVPWFL